MSAKSVPFSVRLPSEDAEFIAALDITGAITPSDKIRHIVSQARKREMPVAGPHEFTRRFEEEFRPIRERLKAMERDSGSESELLDFTGSWLIKLCAEFAEGPAAKDDLSGFEARIARLIAKLTEQMAKMSITSDADCYDPDVIKTTMKRTIELATLICCNQKEDVSDA